MKITAIICEDEAVAARRFKRLLEELEGFEVSVLAHFESVEETARFLLENEHPDVLFLDVHLNDGSSFELFDIVTITSSVIFTTAYDQFAVDAFRRNAADYLLKPIKSNELEEALQKVNTSTTNKALSNDQLEVGYKKRFLVRFGTRLFAVKTNEIAYIYSENKMSFFVLHSGKKIPSDFSMQDLESRLDPEKFFRANRQFIVHIDAIKEMTSYSKSRIKLDLEPPFSSDIIVSTETTRRFKEWLEQ